MCFNSLRRFIRGIGVKTAPRATGRRGRARTAVLIAGAWLTTVVPAGAAAQVGADKADLVVLNAKVWTGTSAGNARPADRPPPTALAVVDGSIVAINTDGLIGTLIGPGTQIVDARGRFLMPGITDSHTHIISGGMQLNRLGLREVNSREEFVKAVKSAAKAKKPGEWVLGGRWSVESWTNPQPPRAEWLDSVTGETPVFLSRMDGHQALVNSTALRLAGIDASGPADPVGGEIERNPETREPTGILKESAMGLVSRLIPDASPDQRYEAFRRAMEHANSLGVTSVHDMSVRSDIDVFRRAREEGTLTLRITTYLSMGDWSDHIDEVAELQTSYNDKMLTIAGFKGFMDGSLGSRTAYMREPFSDSTADTPYPRGQLTAFAVSTEAFRDKVVQADARKMQLAVHAIGDEAIHLLLNAYETARKRNGPRGALNRVEHTQHVLPTDIPRFARLGVVASMQPFHKADDGRYAEKAIGRERLAGSYAFRQLVDSGALVVFGSDWPVVTLNPFAGIDSAVNARTLAGKVWLPSHSLTVEEALQAYTVKPPMAVHREAELGTLEVGKLADMVVLRDDPLTVPPGSLADIKVAYTIVGGKAVYPPARTRK